MAQVPETEITRLVALYRRAVGYLAREFVARVSLDDARTMALVRRATAVLNRLDSAAVAWARRNLGRVYDQTRRETDGMIEERGLALCEPSAAQRRKASSLRAVRAVVGDPGVGFLPALQAATDGIRNRLRLILSQTRVLAAQGQTVEETIGRVGALRGHTAGQVSRALVRELKARKAAADAVWRPRAAALGPQHILANLANLPYVLSPGGRAMRLDRYAELVVRAKARQAETVAQRGALVDRCQGLVSISRNSPVNDDACSLYVGRAFALTAEAAEEWGVPHVDQLPGGGAPFHPNCTHFEVPFFPEMLKQSIVDRATTPPPKWALGRSWAEVEREYRARGGRAYGEKQNPNLRRKAGSGGAKQVAKNQRAATARQRRKAAIAKRRAAG